MAFPVRDRAVKEWALRADKLGEYQETYPEMDVLAECRKALQWILDNPRRRKTPGGMTRFLGSWLAKANDSGRAASRSVPGGGSDGPLSPGVFNPGKPRKLTAAEWADHDAFVARLREEQKLEEEA